MSVQRRVRGGRVRFIGRYRGPDGRERSKSFELRRDAVAWVAKREAEVSAGDWLDPDGAAILIEDLAAAWAAQASTRGTRQIRQQVERNLGSLRGTPIGRLSPPMIRTWVSELSEGRPWKPGCRGLAPATVSSLSSQLRAMLRQAVEDQLIRRNPADGVRVPRPATAITWRELPTAEEVNSLIALARDGGPRKLDAEGRRQWVCASPDMALAVHLMATTGMRTGECCGLTWAAVDWESRRIAVIAQADLTGPGLRELKTGAEGRRTITVDERTMELLAEHRELRRGAERVLLSSAGHPLIASVAAVKFRGMCRYLGLPDAITPKSLRHFHATTLLRAGVPVKTVQQRLGHATARMTLDVYAHVLPEDDEPAAAVVAGVLSAAGPVRDQPRRLRAL